MSWHTFEVVKPGDLVNHMWQDPLGWLTETLGGEWVAEIQHEGECSRKPKCWGIACAPILGRGELGYRCKIEPFGVTTLRITAYGPTPRDAFVNLQRALQ